MQPEISPQTTTERIISMATGFHQAFAEQHSGGDSASVLTPFMETIRNDCERGFAKRRVFLQSLDSLTENRAGQIKQAYNLLLEGVAAFEQTKADELSGLRS